MGSEPVTYGGWVVPFMIALFAAAWGVNFAVPRWRVLLWSTFLLGSATFAVALVFVAWDQGLTPFGMPFVLLAAALAGRGVRVCFDAVLDFLRGRRPSSASE